MENMFKAKFYIDPSQDEIDHEILLDQVSDHIIKLLAKDNFDYIIRTGRDENKAAYIKLIVHDENGRDLNPVLEWIQTYLECLRFFCVNRSTFFDA